MSKNKKIELEYKSEYGDSYSDLQDVTSSDIKDFAQQAGYTIQDYDRSDDSIDNGAMLLVKRDGIIQNPTGTPSGNKKVKLKIPHIPQRIHIPEDHVRNGAIKSEIIKLNIKILDIVEPSLGHDGLKDYVKSDSFEVIERFTIGKIKEHISKYVFSFKNEQYLNFEHISSYISKVYELHNLIYNLNTRIKEYDDLPDTNGINVYVQDLTTCKVKIGPSPKFTLAIAPLNLDSGDTNHHDIDTLLCECITRTMGDVQKIYLELC